MRVPAAARLPSPHRPAIPLGERGYASFDAFLEALSARKRKTIRRERRDALAPGIKVHWLTGRDLTEDVWDTFFAFYMETGSRKWGRPYLTRQFYSLVGERMGDKIVLMMAKRAGRFIAGAINFVGSDAIFGRHWGAVEHHPFLHFELCYYQAIDYAIAHKLKRVEAGAQGEHKLVRGYMPITTHSAHYIADSGLRRAISEYLDARARLCGARRRRACGGRAIPQGFGRSGTGLAGGISMPAYDPNNIFAKIIRGELPCYKVYENDKVLAFMDIMPRAPGHTLVLPKAPARNILDIAPDDLVAVALAAQQVAKAAVKVFGADGVTVQQFNEGAGGQVVFHLHLHIIPRKAGVPMKPPASEKEKPEVLTDHAHKLAAAMKGA